MNISEQSPNNFGGTIVEKYSEFNNAAVIIFPITQIDKNSFTSNPSVILKASHHLELYEEETDSEVYKIGIHTLDQYNYSRIDDSTLNTVYDKAKNLLSDGKFICMIGSEHSFSTPMIRANIEKYYDLSVLHIDARPDLVNVIDGGKNSRQSVMARIVKDMRIPAVQVGIRSISAEEAITLDENLPTRLFWAKDIVGKFDWIDKVVTSLSKNIYLTIDVSGFDPSIIRTKRNFEPGGLGWYEILALIRKVAQKHRIIGMDLVEYQHDEDMNSAFLCAKLIYKSLAYIFNHDTLKVRKARLF